MKNIRSTVVRRGGRAAISRVAQGFTLVEIVTALAVISVATFILLSLFTASYSLVLDDRQVRIALSLAEERLTDITTNPTLYEWPAFDSDDFGPVMPRNPALAPETFEAPSALPPEPKAGRRESALFSEFSWEAHARVPEPDADHIEVVVAVQWDVRGRARRFTVTSATPRTRVGDSR